MKSDRKYENLDLFFFLSTIVSPSFSARAGGGGIFGSIDLITMRECVIVRRPEPNEDIISVLAVMVRPFGFSTSA